MSQIHSIFLLLGLVALAFSPWALSGLREKDRTPSTEDRTNQNLPELLSPVQAAARHMYGEAYGWSPLDMLNYDSQEWIREPWERSAIKQTHPANG